MLNKHLWKNKISMTKMPISMTFNRIFPDVQDFHSQIPLFQALEPTRKLKFPKLF
jgi:hypothetical protein